MKRLLVACALVACGGTTAPTPPKVVRTAPVAKPLRAAHSGVLFVVDYEALLPVGCFNDKIGKWFSGEKCFDILPDDASVMLESGRTVKVSGWRVPTPTQCTLSTPLIMFEDAHKEKPGAWAVWPPDADKRVKRIDWEATKGGTKPFPDKDRAQLGKALSSETVLVVQAASADLDADGASELLYSVNGGGFDPANRKGLAGLFLSHPKADDVVAIRSSDHAVFRVEATFDVDDDGLNEVWISERTFHPNGHRTDSMVLAWHSPGGLTPLPPQESCWPPAKLK